MVGTTGAELKQQRPVEVELIRQPKDFPDKSSRDATIFDVINHIIHLMEAYFKYRKKHFIEYTDYHHKVQCDVIINSNLLYGTPPNDVIMTLLSYKYPVEEINSSFRMLIL